MAITLHFIKILKRLFQDIPDDIYDEDENSTNITSSLNSINNAIIKIANGCKDNGGQFIFGEDAIDDFAEQKDIQSNQATGDRLYLLISNTWDLTFLDEIDNNISGAVYSYLIEFVRYATDDEFEFDPPSTDQFEHLFGDFAKRDDFPVIATCFFCQILFAHFYRRKYNREISETDRNQLLTNEELDKYQFSLPYEDQVTCSYFVYRYIYLPEEREKLYTEKNKYDCGYRSSKHKIYKFAEVNRRIDELNHSEYPTDKSTAFDTFKKKLDDLNLIQKQGKLSKNQYLLKLFLLTNKIKSRRDVVRTAKNDERYGFDVLKMFKSVHIENFKFDGLPYVTKNGFHSTILISEIKKDLDYVDVVSLTAYYIKAMRYLGKTLEFFYDTFYDSSKKYLGHLSKKYSDCILAISVEDKMVLSVTSSENVLKQALSLIYIQAIESCITTMIDVLSYFQRNKFVFVPEDKCGELRYSQYNVIIGTDFSYEDYQVICGIIQELWPELFPQEETRKKKFEKIFKIIGGLLRAIKDDSYNRGECTLRFVVSMVLVCLLADEEMLPSLPEQKFYHLGQQKKTDTLKALLYSEQYSIFKIVFCTIAFEGVNAFLSGRFEYSGYLETSECYYNTILKKIIPKMKGNPAEGLRNMCQFAHDFYIKVFHE